MAREQFQALFKEVYTSASTVNPASIAAGAELGVDVTVTGAALGDFALAAIGVDVVDLNVSAQVTAANTVTVTLGNATAGAIDLASSTWNVVVLHQDFSN